MTADLPSIDLGKLVNYGLGLEHQPGAIFGSAGHISNKNDQTAHLPEVTPSQSKRNSDGQVLQVKFAPNVVVPNLERAKTVVPGFDSVVKVDHKHYEQWARVPGRRVPNNALLRGIQQLKSRMKRESMEQDRLEAGIQNKDFHINQLIRNNLLTRDKLSDDNPLHIRREKSNISTDSGGFRTQIQPRSPLKTSAHMIDSTLLKQEIQASEEVDDREKEMESKTARFLERDGSRQRHVVSKMRDRCPLPVSVYQPISIGDHVFLINEPIKYSDFLKMKKTEYRLKKDPKSATMIFMPDRSGKVVNLPESPGHHDTINTDRKDNLNDSFQRSRTLAGGFPPSRKHKRTPVMVSSAELFDFSQNAELKHLTEDKLFERSKTELSFPSKSGRYTRWVPNVQRLKYVVK